MKLLIRTKHSLSNKYSIDEWVSLKEKNLIGFILGNGNEIYFSRSKLSEHYFLNQSIDKVRNEIIDVIINDLNEKLKLSDVKIEKKLPVESVITGGYLVSNEFEGGFLKEINEDLVDIFFDKLSLHSYDENEVDNILLRMRFSLGSMSIPLSDLSEFIKSKVLRFSPVFSAKLNSNSIFDFVLGVNEVLVLKEGDVMSLEDSVGENIITNTDELSIDLEIVLGSIQMSILDLKKMVVGDFINVENLPLTNIKLMYDNKRLAIAELVYDENKKLALDIKEVYL